MKQNTSGSVMARYGCRCSGCFTENRNLRAGPRGGRGRCRSQCRAVSLSNSGGGVGRPDLAYQVLGSDLKSATRESEWEASDLTRAGPRRGTLGFRLDVRSPELGTARLLPGREEVRTFVRLRWSFDEPEASDTSWGGPQEASSNQPHPAPERADLVSASCKRDTPPSVVNARHHLRTWILSELRT